MNSFLKLCFASIVIFISACSPRVSERPQPERRDLAVVMLQGNGIVKIDAALDVVFEKQDSQMYGDAVLEIHRDGDLQMKVSSLGILGLELSSKNGLVKSNPKLDRNRSAILTRGLRDSLFWWDLADYTVLEEKDQLILLNSTRQVFLDRLTMLPQKQMISFDDGRQLTVFYDNPAQSAGVWYQSKMRIQLSRYSVTLTVRKISFTGKG